MKLHLPTRGLLVLLMMCLACTQIWAQSRKVTGTVLDNETKKPLVGVTVGVKGSDRNVLTDAEGKFTISVPSDQTVLKFTYIGFAYTEFVVGKKVDFNISLSKSNESLDDVVVVGYGTQKKVNVLGAVSTFNPKEVADIPAANLSTALMGQIAGVGVSQTSGKPGATTNISIRSAQTFASGGSTSPLFVIDGLVPIIAASGSVDPTGKTAFDNLDASQVETITVLKDAEAAIYGARGANGVILVTTKRGKSGKPVISYSGSYTTENATKIPEMIDGYSQALLLNNWVQNYYTNPTAAQQTAITANTYTQSELDTIKANNTNNNWFNQIWKPANNQRHTLSVSGGSDRLTYFAGGNYYDETGNLPAVTATKYGLRVGMNAKITPNLTADLTIGMDYSNSNRPSPKGLTGTFNTEQADQLNGTVGGLLSVPGWVPYNINGNPVYYAPLGGYSPQALYNSGNYSRDNSNSVSINASLNYVVPAVKGLSFKVQYGRNTYNDFSKQYYPSYTINQYVVNGTHLNGASGTNIATGTQNVLYTNTVNTLQTFKDGNQLSEFNSVSNNWQLSEGINYNRKFGDHSLAISLYSEQAQTTGDYNTATISTQVIPGIDQFYGFSSDPTNYIISGTSNSTGRVSYLGRLSYSFKDRYLVEGVFRDDASPNFSPSRQWGFFPTVAVGWKISEENFFKKNVNFINDLKVRFNYGLVGNDAVSAFSFLNRYTATSYGYLFGNTLTNGLQYTSLPNPDITWEKSLQKDLGIDGTFGHRRFNFSIDAWYRHQYDMLESPTATVPNTFGIALAAVNHGVLNAKGIEASIGINMPIGKNFTFFANINFGASTNKVIQRYYNAGTDTGYKNPIGKRTDLGITGYKATDIVRTQSDVNDFYKSHPGWKINGDSLRVGDLNYVDVNGDGVIDANDQTQIATRSGSLFGSSFNFGFSWKGLTFRTGISLSVGGNIVYSKLDIGPPTKDAASLAMWKNSYTAANPNAALPAIYSPLVNQGSTYWMHNATSMYINNMQLSYALPSAFITKYKLPTMRFYVTGFNLWTLINPTPYKDPRSANEQNYAILRNFTFGANITL
jgi:TonB-linked SusC/RagA family outer membrane protein